MINPTVFGLMAMANAWGWKEMQMPSEQTDVDGIPEYKDDGKGRCAMADGKTCTTCGLTTCDNAGKIGVYMTYEDCWRPCKTCKTCTKADGCVLKDVAGEPLPQQTCWEPRVRRPKDMVCVLGKFYTGARCHGSQCYLWSKLGPEEETGVPGTCLVALALAGMVEDDALAGVAMEEGE